MIPKFIDKNLIPHKPGVYLYKDEQDKIIYVGKAVDLYSRVSSYFSGPQYPRTAELVKRIRGLETIIVESEIEALVLEANLIKKHLPLFNVKLTDDKDYLYIKVTKEPFPQILTSRKKQLEESLSYFGPFPSASTVKSTLKRLRRVFPWCSNPENKTKRPCFYYHLGLCPGACCGMISQEDYMKIIKRFIKFMDGKSDELVNELENEMEELSKKLDFEGAQRVKKILQGISYLLSPNQTQAYLENPNFLQDQNNLALQSLQKVLDLPTIPERVECFDISNTQGTDAVGSMVVLTHGEIDKSQYRKFKIKISGKPDDYGMISEMLGRRVKHDEWEKPDLILIDGGRGQVRAAYEVLQKVSWEVPLFGLAKRMEWLYPPTGEVLKLPKRNMGLRLLQKIRDEAHRFGLSYHRKLRSKEFLK
jgi:excinuclease ABC subunit C